MQNKPIVIGLFTLVALALGWMVLAPSPAEKNLERDVENAWNTYVQAFVAGDGRKACDQLTEAARAAVKVAAVELGAKDCADAFTRTRDIGGDEVANAVRRIRVHKVRIKGSEATIELRQGEQDSIAQLLQVGDDWKIASLPKS